ncbi:MAG: M23 family metallopeptidase [Oligoflexia bacterium]|nr:M23 family metallopeptidase [Oligoflexia bacterium]
MGGFAGALAALILAGCLRPTADGDSGVRGDTAATTVTSGEPTTARLPIQLALPLVDRDRFNTLVGVDHDPADQDGSLVGRAICLDYLGRSFPHCYDGHDGSDYILSGGFSTMDSSDTVVVAAADGVVSYAEDGHYDRCHGDLATGDVSCDGYDIVANAVIIDHSTDDGGTWQTMYWHLAQGSVAVAVGQAVSRGDQLGLVGSSGYSSMPHLHFELQQVDGTTGSGILVDPYAGPYSQDATAWCDQGVKDQLPGDCSD